MRSYVDDCLKGADGPRERDFNMRWIASLVAEAYRILVRGGVFLYPGDAGPATRTGGCAWSTRRTRSPSWSSRPAAPPPTPSARSSTSTPQSLHERVPLVFGSAREVARVARYHIDPAAIAERSPLFGKRGLFRA